MHVIPLECSVFMMPVILAGSPELIYSVFAWMPFGVKAPNQDLRILMTLKEFETVDKLISKAAPSKFSPSPVVFIRGNSRTFTL